MKDLQHTGSPLGVADIESNKPTNTGSNPHSFIQALGRVREVYDTEKANLSFLSGEGKQLSQKDVRSRLECMYCA